jgi:hypothetical protein
MKRKIIKNENKEKLIKMKTKFKICEVFTRKFDNKVRLVISRTNIYMGLMNMLQFYVAWLGLKKSLTI